MRIAFIGETDPGRDAAEAHVRQIYREAHGAEVRAFAPRLVVARGATGQITCVAGIRTAEDGFFSTVYLDQPVERALSRLTQAPVAPEAVLEVVSLASVSPFPVLPVLNAIIGWGRARRITWGLFTATAPLRRLLVRAGMPFAELGAADPGRLTAAEAAAWGRYYDASPRVCAFSDTLRQPLVLTRRAGG